MHVLDLHEGYICFDLGLKRLRKEDTPVVTKGQAVELVNSTILEVKTDLVLESNASSFHLLLNSGHREERDVVLDRVEGKTVEDGEDPVSEAADLACSGGELLDLDAILAGDALIV